MEARPSVGKTAFALNIVNNLCFKQNRSVGFFTLEMPSKSIVRRLISLNADIEYHKIYSNLMNKNELIAYNKSLSELNKLSLYIESTQGIQIYELKAQSRQMKKNSNVEIIFIDYISLITVSHNDIPRFEQVEFLSRTIRVLALELEILIIALSQVARSTEGKEPSLATLREL
ncbi:DnaB-like helicase C-terminal domain-containing protein [Borreliella bavariensis]|uniref:DnaB-like helicase C-terminal domain-containing protein n=1 Tax=Borreliella bavariensis TaxID=664662 RepID=UPI002D803F0F|nr:DnaB-like helicase C-terminal domain-containing protein [Borreliella bavariensis]